MANEGQGTGATSQQEEWGLRGAIIAVKESGRHKAGWHVVHNVTQLQMHIFPYELHK